MHGLDPKKYTYIYAHGPQMYPTRYNGAERYGIPTLYVEVL